MEIKSEFRFLNKNVLKQTIFIFSVEIITLLACCTKKKTFKIAAEEKKIFFLKF